MKFNKYFYIFIVILLCSCSNQINKKQTSLIAPSLENKPSIVGDIPCSFPLTKDGDTLNIAIVGYEDIQAEDVYVWKKYEEMTGVKVNWTNVKKGDRAKFLHTILTNNNEYDLVLRFRTSSTSLTNYGTAGLLYDLTDNDMLKKYAPNCWAFLHKHPDTLASIQNPDGSIYSIPQVNSGAELRVSRKIFVNKNWLANVNMELPKTTEEFYQLLKAFKEQDANGNGKPDDEIPFCSQDWLSIKEAFYGSFGLGNRGIHNNFVDWDYKNNKIRFIQNSNEYKDFLKYFNKLYKEGLLDKSIFSIQMAQWLSLAETDRIGVFVNTNLATLPAQASDNWIAIEEPLTGPNGDKLHSATRANFHSTGAAMIPKASKKPELALAWLDYFWTDEGTLFYHMGIENDTFIANPDGTFKYSPHIYDEIKEAKSFDDVVAKYSPYPGGGNPTVETAPYFMGGEMAEIPAKAALSLFKYGPEEYWPSFTFTSEENQQLLSYKIDIDKFYQDQCIQFIIGLNPFSEWETYTKHLDTLGVDEFLNIYQAAVDRYTKLKNEP